MHQEPHGPNSRTRIDFSLEACLAQIIDHAELATAGERDSSRNADLPFCDEDREYMEHAIECGTLNSAHDEAVEADAMNNMRGVELPIQNDGETNDVAEPPNDDNDTCIETPQRVSKRRRRCLEKIPPHEQCEKGYSPMATPRQETEASPSSVDQQSESHTTSDGSTLPERDACTSS